jgi:hypothetical protein
MQYLDATDTDFAAGTGTPWSFKGPKGKQGILRNIGVHVKETFEDDTITGKVLVGTTADPNAYGQLEIADGTANTDTFNNVDDPDCVILASDGQNNTLPADTQIEVTFVQATDSGVAAGKGRAYVEVDWY